MNKWVRRAILASSVWVAMGANAYAIPLEASYTPATPLILDSDSESIQFSFSQLGVIQSFTITIDLFKCGGEYDASNPTLPFDVSTNKCLSDAPAFANEISLRILAPSSLSLAPVYLIDPYIVPNNTDAVENGPEPGGRIQLTFDDDSSRSRVNRVVFESGTFASVSPFAFLGMSTTLEPWFLEIADDTLDSPLGLMSFRVSVDIAPFRVPEPGSLALLLGGLLAAGVTWRRIRAVPH